MWSVEEQEAVRATTRLQKRIVKKKYYGKSEYAYTVYAVSIPKRLHEFLPLFLDKELVIDGQLEGKRLILIIKPKVQNP